MIKICMFAMISSLVVLGLKGYKSAYASGIGVFVVIILAGIAVRNLKTYFSFMSELWEQLPVDRFFFQQMLKMVGICYLTELSASICREQGSDSVAKQLEFIGKISVLILGIPGIRYLLEVMAQFV